MRGVSAIFRDVKALITRDAVRAKYRRSRPKLGYGTTTRCPDSTLVADAPAHMSRVGDRSSDHNLGTALNPCFI